MLMEGVMKEKKREKDGKLQSPTFKIVLVVINSMSFTITCEVLSCLQ